MGDELKPMKYRDRFYVVNMTIPESAPGAGMLAGAGQTGSVTIQNFPFYAKRVGHAILGPNQVVNVGITTHNDISQDGQYAIRIRANEKSFMNAPVSALGGFGGGQFSQPIDLEAPIAFNPNDTVAVDVFTTIDRKAGVTIQVILEGVEPYEA